MVEIALYKYWKMAFRDWTSLQRKYFSGLIIQRLSARLIVSNFPLFRSPLSLRPLVKSLQKGALESHPSCVSCMSLLRWITSWYVNWYNHALEVRVLRSKTTKAKTSTENAETPRFYNHFLVIPSHLHLLAKLALTFLEFNWYTGKTFSAMDIMTIPNCSRHAHNCN